MINSQGLIREYRNWPVLPLRQHKINGFGTILNETGFRPEHTLFIDDTRQHIEAAALLGIRTIWLQPGMTIEEHVFLPKGQE